MPNINESIEKAQVSIELVCSILKSNFPRANINKVVEAYNFAKDAHEGQLRKSGEEYIYHPLFVSYLAALIKLDESSVIAALLHDTIEDTKVSLDEIVQKYGEDTAFLVDGLTNIKKVTKNVRVNHNNFESLRKLLIASTKDVRVILIKLADRLHNTMTIYGLSEERRKTYALENLKFYAPLADFVGINFFRKKIEDYSFRQLEPDVYNNISAYLTNNGINEGGKLISREEYLEKQVKYFEEILKEAKIKATVFGRSKGVYSIYRKIIKKHKIFDIQYVKDVNDLIGITILVNSIAECYRVLGVVHSKLEHVPALFDDYIAKPKDNGYRSIHTCLLSSDNVKTALQIKTFKMHEYNEYGPASHIYYKEKEKGNAFANLGSKFFFLKSLVRWKEEVKNIEYYKVDVFKDKIFVFTPTGDVKELIKSATGVDFAYLIHTNIGNSCKGIKVNGVIKPLDYELKTGDVVEILTDKKRVKPSQDWLSFVKTPYAKTNIRRALREEEAEEMSNDQYEEDISNIRENPQEEEIITENDVLDDLQRRIISEKISDANIVKIKGIDNIDCSIAKCCSPIPGDDIIGHVTKSRGIRIHKKNCKDLAGIGYKVLLDAEWVGGNKDFLTGIYIKSSSDDNAELIKEISKLLSDMKIRLEKIDSWNNNGFNGRIAVNVNSKSQLDNLMKKLKKINKVSNVERININQ